MQNLNLLNRKTKKMRDRWKKSISFLFEEESDTVR
ncbi:hypothetical protein RUMGNA_00613 [Mediterraneibacter gnavus ATCC 29149]|uniref:Uncharacterized protein n=1 Tax=Mediterraneibacter gnavus (strain ATCC 29149 / DSM 114966 / JCM 6515 / VPI C7-9) TaxID=411470 RepID=A7AZ97_MEDG7|nr:hypothetical protein RUMGNA_00613 [Mediterraneibacter gnavus ATCC 29149]